METAVSFPSPVIITTWTPAFVTSSMLFAASSLNSSLMHAIPTRVRFENPLSSLSVAASVVARANSLFPAEDMSFVNLLI
ncbi:hypothetical protein SDC9_56016 [bioreactor metagenome]|uniref:Uncharacterized protein n=1 Tax=bioreactor metagenome TaxID=1076179 RepID=A0A644X6B5_9ZZZZ